MAKAVDKKISLDSFHCEECIDKISEDIASKHYDVDIKRDNINIVFTIKLEKEYKKIIKLINNVLLTHKHSDKIHDLSNPAQSLLIGNLSCAHCALRIEDRVKGLSGVKEANLDFVNSKLNIVVDDAYNFSEVLKETKNIIKEVEPEAYIKNTNEFSNYKETRKIIVLKTITNILLGVVPFLLGMFLEYGFTFKLIMFILSYLIIGRSVIIKSFKTIAKGIIFDENTLMLIATIGAFAIGEYFEAIAVMLLYAIGEMFQDLAVQKSRKSISDLMDIKSEYANLKQDDRIIEVRAEDVEINDFIVVRPGEKVPLDGIVTEGEGMVDTSSITGESLPRYIRVNEEIVSGFINLEKVITIKVQKEYKDSTVSKIIEMVENASSKKAVTENFITKFSRYYTPIVVGIAILLTLIPTVFLSLDFNTWLYRSLSFLVVSCPCAFVISVPLGFYAGIGFASRNGILIRGGNFLEALKNVDEIVFDKTGTLTTGRFVVREVHSVNYSKEKLVELAAMGEYYSTHPIARAIINAHKGEINSNSVRNYQEIPGQGISVTIDGLNVLVGNKRLMKSHEIELSDITSSHTIIYVAVDNKYEGHLVIGDEIKEEAPKVVNHLRKLGVKKISLLTGDKEEVALEVGKALGLDEVYYEALPQDKVEIITSKVNGKNNKLAFVGDGINDAPVLAAASIGISMGTIGSDAAIEASDIVIMNDNLEKIVVAKRVAKETSKKVWQNIIFALAVKVAVLILAAFGIANMWAAVFADVGVSLIAIINAMQILRKKQVII